MPVPTSTAPSSGGLGTTSVVPAAGSTRPTCWWPSAAQEAGGAARAATRREVCTVFAAQRAIVRTAGEPVRGACKTRHPLVQRFAPVRPGHTPVAGFVIGVRRARCAP